MEVFVKFEVFDTIHEREDVLAVRQDISSQIQKNTTVRKVERVSRLL